MNELRAVAAGAMLAIIAMGLAIVFITKPAIYDKAIKEYKAGKATYTVTVTPEGADTTWVYKP